MTRTRVAPVTPLIVAAALCGLPLVASAVPAATLTDAKAVNLATEVAKTLGMPKDKRIEVIDRLEATLARPAFKKKYKKSPVHGVFAYQFGEGGFVVKLTRGKGLAKLATGVEKRFAIKSTSFGAMIGGSSEWGVGIILGLDDVSSFGGRYKGSVRGGTFVDTSGNTLELSRDEIDEDTDFHRLYLIGSGSGASASAGAVKLSIIVE